MANGARVGWAGWLMLLLVLVPYANRYGVKLLGPDAMDLSAYYWAAQVAFNDRASPYGPGAFAGVERAIGAAVLPFLYPPPSLLLFYPLSRVSYQTAKVGLLAVNFACLLGSLGLLLRHLDFPRRARRLSHVVPFLVAYVFALPAITYTLLGGQVNLVLLLLLTLFWVGLKRRWPAAATAAPLALAVVLKAYPILLVPMLIVRRQVRTAVACLAGVAVLTAASAAALPTVAWRDFVTKVLPDGGYGITIQGFPPGMTHTIGLNAFTARVFLGGDELRPVAYHPVAARRVPQAACAALVLAALGLSWRAARRRREAAATGDAAAGDANAGGVAARGAAADPDGGALDLEFSLYLLTIVLVAPLAWEHHVTYALPALLAVLVRVVLVPGPAVRRAVAAAAVLVLAWPQFGSFPDVYGLRLIGMSNKFLAVAVTWGVVAAALWRATARGEPAKAPAVTVNRSPAAPEPGMVAGNA